MSSIFSMSLTERLRLANTVGRYHPDLVHASPASFVRAAEQACQAFPNDWVVLYTLADKYQELGEYQKALDCTKRLVDLRPQDVRSAYALATSYNLLTRAFWANLDKATLTEIASATGENLHPELAAAALSISDLTLDEAARESIRWFEYALTLPTTQVSRTQISHDLYTLYKRFPHLAQTSSQPRSSLQRSPYDVGASDQKERDPSTGLIFVFMLLFAPLYFVGGVIAAAIPATLITDPGQFDTAMGALKASLKLLFRVVLWFLAARGIVPLGKKPNGFGWIGIYGGVLILSIMPFLSWITLWYASRQVGRLWINRGVYAKQGLLRSIVAVGAVLFVCLLLVGILSLSASDSGSPGSVGSAEPTTSHSQLTATITPDIEPAPPTIPPPTLTERMLAGAWREYSNPRLGFALQIPAGWTVEEIGSIDHPVIRFTPREADNPLALFVDVTAVPELTDNPQSSAFVDELSQSIADWARTQKIAFLMGPEPTQISSLWGVYSIHDENDSKLGVVRFVLLHVPAQKHVYILQLAYPAKLSSDVNKIFDQYSRSLRLSALPTVRVGANLRADPSTDSAKVGGVAAGTVLYIDGISQDKQWYHLSTNAWIFADLVDNPLSRDTLRVISP